MTINEALTQARVDHRNGRLREAEALYRTVLAAQPEHPEALHLLGVIAAQAGRPDMAADLIRRAIFRNPGAAEYHANLGLALAAEEQWPAAIDAYQHALALRADFPDALHNLGKAFDRIGQPGQAVQCFQQAIALRPDFASARSSLAQTLCMNGETDAAIAEMTRVIALSPNSAEGYNNLGNALYRRGDAAGAEQACRNAVALRPDLPDAHLNLAVALLMQGRLVEGWKEYAWRSQVQGTGVQRRQFAQPKWDGSALNGRRILIHAEQGFGDIIQFVRYIPMVAQRGGRVIADCPKELLRLLSGEIEIERWITNLADCGAFDVHCPLLDLPMVFGISLESIPSVVPYLKADAALVEKWRERLENGAERQLRVGLVWAGSAAHAHDRKRWLELSELVPLAAVGGVRFISLQKGTFAGEAKNPPSGMQLMDWTDELNDFSDTAALIENLDLVITIDSAVAHLAGAMGKAVWVLLRSFPDWRWMLGREDSPWYPTMRLFRQASAGEWGVVVRKVAEELEELVMRLGW